jgi:hypothetical protein
MMEHKGLYGKLIKYLWDLYENFWPKLSTKNMIFHGMFYPNQLFKIPVNKTIISIGVSLINLNIKITGKKIY